MKRHDPVEVNEPYNTEIYHNFVETPQYVPRPNRSRSKSPIKRLPNAYSFVPLNENRPPSTYTVQEMSFEENQLPHYVVPVLYIPQRIITNEEFYASELYDKVPVPEEVHQENPQYQSQPQNRARPHEHLTDSETDIYDELMAKLYGMEQPEQEIAVENNFTADYTPSLNLSQRLLLPEPILEDNPKYSEPPNSTTSMRSEYKRKQTLLRTKQSPYVLRTPTCSPSTSAYTVYPIKQEYLLHQKENSRISPRDSSVSRKKKFPEPAVQLATPVPMQSMFNSSFILKEGPSESKCTQTTADMSTETGDYNVKKMQKVEKIPSRSRSRAKSLNCSNADVTLIIDRGSDENVYTVLGSGSQYLGLQDSKFDKATECLATVDLLPVASSTLGQVGKKILSIPKLRAHSRPHTPRP